METERHGIVFWTTIVDYQRGNLVFAEIPQDIGFEVKRVFWVYGNHDGEWRAGHAHRKCKQVLFAVHGSVTVEAGDIRYDLNDPGKGLFIDAGVNVSYRLDSISSVLFVLASEHYDPEDYINGYKVS